MKKSDSLKKYINTDSNTEITRSDSNEFVFINSKDDLEIQNIKNDLRTSLTKDLDIWNKTLQCQDKENDNVSKLKINTLKKVMLLIGSNGMEVKGFAMNKDETIVNSEPVTSHQNDKFPVSEYISGRMGRVYATLPKGQSETLLNWLAGDENNIRHNSHILPGNCQKQLKNTQIIYNRQVATHGGNVEKDGSFTESKSLIEAMKGYVSSFVGHSNHHYGINLAIGGDGQKDYFGQEIKGDGSSGHLYINIDSRENGDFIGFGLEGTAPGTTGSLGAHSSTGGADRFTALEGLKYAIKFDAESDDIKSYIKSYIIPIAIISAVY
jgi:hypothetical protein